MERPKREKKASAADLKRKAALQDLQQIKEGKKSRLDSLVVSASGGGGSRRTMRCGSASCCCRSIIMTWQTSLPQGVSPVVIMDNNLVFTSSPSWYH